MAISNFMMLLSFIVVSYLVSADVIRDDGYLNYGGQFSVVHKGRMLRVLMYFNHIHLETCALHCVRHLRCRTINYHHVKKACELTDEDFDEMNVDIISPGWYNHGTPPKVDGEWSSWRNFTECTKTCGGATIEQWRDCDSPKPEYGGVYCKGRMRRRVKCNTKECPEQWQRRHIIREETAIKTENHVTKFNRITRQFIFNFDLKMTSFNYNGYRGIAMLSNTNNDKRYILRIYTSHNRVIRFVRGINETHKKTAYLKKQVPNQWVSWEATQLKQPDGSYVYKIEMDGKQVYSDVNDQPESFENVQVFVDKGDKPQPGLVRNMWIKLDPEELEIN